VTKPIQKHADNLRFSKLTVKSIHRYLCYFMINFVLPSVLYVTGNNLFVNMERTNDIIVILGLASLRYSYCVIIAQIVAVPSAIFRLLLFPAGSLVPVLSVFVFSWYLYVVLV